MSSNKKTQKNKTRDSYMMAGPVVTTPPTYKERVDSFFDTLQDFFINEG